MYRLEISFNKKIPVVVVVGLIVYNFDGPPVIIIISEPQEDMRGWGTCAQGFTLDLTGNGKVLTCTNRQLLGVKNYSHYLRFVLYTLFYYTGAIKSSGTRTRTVTCNRGFWRPDSPLRSNPVKVNRILFFFFWSGSTFDNYINCMRFSVYQTRPALRKPVAYSEISHWAGITPLENK